VANDLCPYTCVVENCPTPYNLFGTQEEWNDHAINDHPPCWQCPCCGGDPPIFKSLSGITSHLMAEHSEQVADNLGEFLLDAEINVMGITTCPLCDSEGPQDSLDLIEHVLQHVHDFSLRSLPWPADLPITLDKSVGLFDMNYAVKIDKNDGGNELIFDIAGWAETVVPIFDRSRGELVCNDSEGNELVLGAASSLKTLEDQVSLQLCDLDRNPPKTGEDASIQLGSSEWDYFSQVGNDYFVDESSDGRFSQTSNSTRQTQNTARSTEKLGPKPWICPICHLHRMPEGILGDKEFFKHLIHIHPGDRDEIEAAGGEDRWMQYMLAEAYWLGMSVPLQLSPIALVY
jgi:hypothetical protein